MSDQLEVRIVCEPKWDGSYALFMYDPITCRTSEFPAPVHKTRLEGEVRKIKDNMERKGFRVTVKEM